MIDAEVRRAGAAAVFARRRTTPAWRREIVRSGLIDAVILLLATAGIVWAILPGAAPLWIRVATAVLMLAVMWGGHLWFLTPEIGRQTIVFRTQAGQCPACCYPISDLSPEPDGCVVCPECGAAWRMESREPQPGVIA